jgi:DNA helicase-2/ATP-dependent DNA helicase PcrA
MSKSNFIKSYNGLNKQQKLAVDTLEGPVLVVAGPGTGKTQLLSLRVANILDKTPINPSSILCLTFTDNAAFNMRQRLNGIIGRDGYKVAIHTFHSFGTEIINQNPEYFFFGSLYKPADDFARIAILEQILSSLPISNPLNKWHPSEGWTYRKNIESRIRDLKQGGLTPEKYKQILQQNWEFLSISDDLISGLFDLPKINSLKLESVTEFYQKFKALPHNDYSQKLLATLDQAVLQTLSGEKFSHEFMQDWREQNCAKDNQNKHHLKDFLNYEKHLALYEIYSQYQENLHAQRLFDFEDMLLEVVSSFEKYPELKYNYQEKFEYILIDEFQDTNGVQMDLVNNLINMEVTERRPNILVVGDDDQAIFKFQKATLKNILEFREKYLDPKIITLTQNYRSNQKILDFAENVICQSSTRLAHWPEVNKKLTAAT